MKKLGENIQEILMKQTEKNKTDLKIEKKKMKPLN